MGKKLISLLLALVMTLSMLPLDVWAEERNVAASAETVDVAPVQETSAAEPVPLHAPEPVAAEYVPTPKAEPASESVAYRSASWNGSEVIYADESVSSYTVVADDTIAWEDGWYVVNSDVTINTRVTLTGTANLILCDDCTLTASNGVITQKSFKSKRHSLV